MVSRQAWLIGLVGGVALGAAAQAAESDDLVLVGTVAQILDIQVNPTASANGLDLALQQADLKVADVVTQSNTPGGYVVTVSSANIGAGNCNPALLLFRDHHRQPGFHAGRRPNHADVFVGDRNLRAKHRADRIGRR